MKRLILVGGRPWLAPDKGKHFTEVLFRYFSKEVKLAFCIFAQPETDWDETRKINLDMFEAHKGDRALQHQTMTVENFAEVSAWADIVYLPGGSSSVLTEKIRACGDVAALWDGKLIAGASAGANLFCKGFMSLQERTYGKGLGWVQATCIPHWRSDFNSYTDADWDWAEQELLRQEPDAPVLCLTEYDFVEMTIK